MALRRNLPTYVGKFRSMSLANPCNEKSGCSETHPTDRNCRNNSSEFNPFKGIYQHLSFSIYLVGNEHPHLQGLHGSPDEDVLPSMHQPLPHFFHGIQQSSERITKSSQSYQNIMVAYHIMIRYVMITSHITYHYLVLSPDKAHPFYQLLLKR